MRPEDAELACGAAKIDRPAPAAPSGEASTGADTSKTLRRSSFVLSEVRAIYVREARTLKTGPPAASRTVRGDGSLLAPGASALSGWPTPGRGVRQGRVDARLGRSGRARSQATIDAAPCPAAGR